jgi:hypothetical protein
MKPVIGGEEQNLFCKSRARINRNTGYLKISSILGPDILRLRVRTTYKGKQLKKSCPIYVLVGSHNRGLEVEVNIILGHTALQQTHLSSCIIH